MTAMWREDIDALQFEASGGRLCMVHRLAFRALTGLERPSPDDCLEFYEDNSTAFHRAADEKIARAGGPDAGNFHLTSRDVQGSIRPEF